MQNTIKLSGAKLTSNQTAGAIIWMISAFTTALFIKQMGVKEPLSYVLGIAIQWLFTKAETPIWRKQGYPALGLIVTGVDVLFNAIGVWPYVRDNLANTDLWRMVADLTHDPSPPTLLVRFAIVLVIGIAVAAGPEYFFSRKES
jgi:predicted membrane channel-forming protein YqfA (hemolysin III family)